MKYLPGKLILLLFPISSFAQTQFRLPSFKSSPAAASSFQINIQRIVADYPNQFDHIKGEVVEQNPQSVVYQSLIVPVGAEGPTITQYSSKKRAVYSWQAEMLSTEDFDQAAKKYKSLFNQLKGTNVVFNASHNYYLQGTYEEADESKKFTNTILNFATREEPMNKLKVEINIQYEFPEWKVNLLIYERERADDERGNIFDN